MTLLAWPERFWAKVDMAAGLFGCWPWMAARIPKGYGHIHVSGRGMVKAPRLVLEAVLGRPLLPGEQACHHCDNPPCVNPMHLYAGSASDNARDMVARGRIPPQMRRRERCRRGHELVDDNIWIGSGARRCKTCWRAYKSGYNRRRREEYAANGGAYPAPRTPRHKADGDSGAPDHPRANPGVRFPTPTAVDRYPLPALTA
jgi:hypothetical protein